MSFTYSFITISMLSNTLESVCILKYTFMKNFQGIKGLFSLTIEIVLVNIFIYYIFVCMIFEDLIEISFFNYLSKLIFLDAYKVKCTVCILATA